MGYLKFVKIGIDRAVNEILIWPSIKLKKCLVKPVHVYWMMSRSCNFRCQFCHTYRINENKEDLVTFPEIKRVIDEMAKWGITQMGLSGGEPLLNIPRLMDTLEYANKKGLYTHFVTNAYLLTEEVLQKYSSIGGGYVTISIDGLERVHDTSRGTKGSFSRCINALEMISRLRLKNVKMKITTVLNDNNLDEILGVVSIAEKYGVPILITPYNSAQWDKVNHEDEPCWVSRGNLEKLKSVVGRLVEIRKNKGNFIINPTRQLREFLVYFENKIHGESKVCLLGYTNITIHENGDVACCFAGVVGNIKNKSLREIWYSKEYERARQRMLTCTSLCLAGCRFRFSLAELIKLGISWLLK